MSDQHVIEVLALFNILQLLFWGYQVHTLVNKLMSKNFAEYNFIKKGPQVVESLKDEDDDFEEQDILNELNGMLPKGAS